MEILYRLNSSRASVLTQKNLNITKIAVRLALLLICILFAIVIPELENIISLIGCIFFSSLGELHNDTFINDYNSILFSFKRTIFPTVS